VKKKMPKGVFFFQDPIYCQEFLVIVTSTHAKFRKFVKEYLNYDIEKDDKCTGQFNGISNSKESRDVGIIWASNRKESLIHEIFHAVSYVMRNRDITLDSSSSEETWAYYISYLYREIQERLSK
jgi:hypothetical protein